MSERVVSLQAMPKTLLQLVKAKTVKIREDSGVITVTPIEDQEESPLRGFWSDGALSTERFFEQKRLDKELEENDT